MDKDEFLTFVDAASKVVAQAYSLKRFADTTGIHKPKIILLSLAVILAFFFMILIYLAIYYDNDRLEISSYAALLMAFLIVLPLTMHECLRYSDNKFVSFN